MNFNLGQIRLRHDQETLSSDLLDRYTPIYNKRFSDHKVNQSFYLSRFPVGNLVLICLLNENRLIYSTFNSESMNHFMKCNDINLVEFQEDSKLFIQTENKLCFMGELSPLGTKFQHQVWKTLLNIRPGSMISYSELSKKLGVENSVRAVANAVAANPILYFIPCHRVIRKNHNIGGYREGILLKKDLLLLEGCRY